jgi:hypothetical protein
MRNDFLINVTSNITTGDPSASINQLTLNTNFVASLGNATAGQMYIGAGLNKNTITDDGSAVSTVTMVQSAGIFALTPLQSISEYTGLGSTTISHYAGLVINGIKSTTGSQITITNNYQLLINSSQQFSGSTTITNSWGIYQNGANDLNYFAGNVAIGTSSRTSTKLLIDGNLKVLSGFSEIFKLTINSELYTPNIICQTDFTFISQGGGTIMKLYKSSQNVYIGDSPVDNGRRLTIQGEQEWKSITFGTGAHTTSGNHLPIWVNGFQYWLALLNPVLP